MDTVDTSRYKIPLLSTDNYFIWSHKVEFILRSEGIWGIVSGTEIEPTDEEERQTPGSKSKFIRRQDVALTNIILTIDDSCNAAVITLREPKQVWDTLKNMYEAVSEACIDVYLAKYRQMRMEPTEKTMKLVDRMSELENKLTAIDHSIDAKDKRRVLIRGLREEFGITAGVIRTTKKTYQEAISELVTHEADIKSEIQPEKERDSVFTIGRNEEQCGYCCKRGHTSEKCFFNPDGSNYKPILARKRNDRRRSRMHRKGSSSFEKNSYPNRKKGQQDSAYVDMAFVTKYQAAKVDSVKASAEKSYVDSGASAHMCNNQNHFSTFSESTNCHQVSVGDGKPVKVIGIGTVMCQATVEGKPIKIALNNVFCVPDLMCNLCCCPKT